MQQLYLTGTHAAAMAEKLFTALNVRPAGYQLTPFTVGGGIRGEALHLLTPPCVPMDNDVPCRIRLRTGDWTIIPRVLDEIAAPTLLQARTLHAPILLGGVTGTMLTCRAFREAVVSCLKSDSPVIVAASDDAEDILDDDGEVIILKVEEDKDGETYLCPIENAKEFDEVQKIFEERLSDLFEDTDE